MRTLTSSRSVAPLSLAATLLAAFVLLFAWPQPAAAHDSLVESSPAADSTVETLPGELSLTFSAALIGGDGSTEIVVTDAAGESVTDGPAELDGAMVTQPLVAEADAGEYHVLWKVVSSDGHPTSGEFGFTVATSTLAAEPSAAPTETVAPAPDETQAPAPADDPDMESGASFSPGWLIGGAVVLVVVAIALFLLLRRRRPRDSESDTPAER
ncbi:copper resistance CopC family protein [Microbacterium abyssi]|uniref:copper resistance CopC family protein n=1 Tax=Microbacterium abyssi TaxID=2782166 RepID=UPI00188852CF|nr:copper resistance CopC family protein [Microbacterium sp. A18JL241]